MECPYCHENLELGDDVQEITQCSICHEITCSLCTEEHYRDKHEAHLPWQYGYLNNDGIFIFKDFSFVED